MSKLEKKFTEELQKKIKEARAQIDINVEKAKHFLHKAEIISERSGVPFQLQIADLDVRYHPKSFRDKWEDYSDKDIEMYLKHIERSMSRESGWHNSYC